MKIEDNQIRIINNFLPDDIFKEFQMNEYERSTYN